MLDWLWQIIASVAALAASYMGARVSWLKWRMERDKAERAAAEQKQITDSTARLAAVRNKYSAQAEPDARKRTDFEGDGA